MARQLSVVMVAALATGLLSAQDRFETATVAAVTGERSVTLPGELHPYASVELVARVAGYVEQMHVDRGTEVRAGQVLATLVAPELAAQLAEADARVGEAVARQAEAEAELASARLTDERLSAAAQTPGAVAGLELKRAAEVVKAAAARVDAASRSTQAARAAHDAVRSLEGYLRVTAPFSGRVTERLVHPGALVGPAAGPLLRLEQVGRLRLTVAVPEQHGGRPPSGSVLAFRVPAYGSREFTGTVARFAGTLDARTRTMAVELDVENDDGVLAPGMFPSVSWPVTPREGTVLVPATAVVSTTERTFVVRVRDGRAEWVTVRKGAVRGDSVEVTGALQVGERVLKRGTDEARDGQRVP